MSNTVEKETCLQLVANHIASEENASRMCRYYASWASTNGWSGTEAYFRKETKEEMKHTRLWQEYADDRNLPPFVSPQPRIDIKFDSLLELFTYALKDMYRTLNQLFTIAKAAEEEGDVDVLNFLPTFTNAAVASIRDWEAYVKQLKLAGSDPAALLVFDQGIAP